MDSDNDNNNNVDFERQIISQITNELLSAKQCCDKLGDIFTRISNQFQATINSTGTILPLQTEPQPLRKKSSETLEGENESKGKRKKKSIFGKIYPVQTISNGEKKIGYRVHTKYMDVNRSIGPYASFDQATTIKQLIQTKLKEFDSNDPDVERMVKKKLNELKLEYDRLYPPLKMVRVHKKKH